MNISVASVFPFVFSLSLCRLSYLSLLGLLGLLSLSGCGHQTAHHSSKSASGMTFSSGEFFDSDSEEESTDDVFAMAKGTGRGGELNSSATLSFDWPVDEARLTQEYRPQKKRKKRPHWGIDLAARKGTEIFASHGGTVIYAGKAFRGYGKMVLIESGSGWASLYAHLSKIEIRQGDRVRLGDLIAEMGSTGRATGTHLHFEIRKNRKPVNPLDWLPQVGVAELFPNKTENNPSPSFFSSFEKLFAVHPSLQPSLDLSF